MPRRLLILGSTGSIGTQALDVVDAAPEGTFEIVGLAAGRRWETVVEQARRYGVGRIVLADVAPEDIRKLTADVPKKRIAKPRPGDVLAIPARDGGYHMAVVVAQNRFGCAVGLFHGTSAQGRMDAGLRQSPRKYPVHTSEDLVMNGTWKIVNHDASLLALFPSDPVIYHRPNASQGIDTGEFGAAETADCTLRLIGPDEAREVGLLDGTYRQTRHAALLQKQLNDKADLP